MSEAVKRKGSVMVKIGLSAASLLLASSQAVQGAVTIFDFEDGKAPKIFSKTYTVGVTNAFATSGAHGLRFRCDPWRKGMPEWPSFNLHTSVRDWRGYDRLAIDVVSLGEATGDSLSIFIAGPEGRIQNGLHRSLRLSSRSYVQWIVKLNDWPAETSPTNIARVHLFTSNPQAVDLVIEAGVLGNFGFNTVRPLIWGFNFLFGTLFAILEKALLRGLHKKGVIRREYTNVFMQNRIAGFMFDLMVVASIAAIDLSAFSKSEFIVPLSIICVAGAAVTYAYLSFLCPRVFPNYSHEAFLSLYGMQTGTASTGVILLREMDPNFETQASDNIVYHQPWAIVFGFPMLLLLPVAAQSLTKGWITLGILIALFAVMQVIVFRKSIFKKKKA